MIADPEGNLIEIGSWNLGVVSEANSEGIMDNLNDTDYLLSSPVNAEHLCKSIQEAQEKHWNDDISEL